MQLAGSDTTVQERKERINLKRRIVDNPPQLGGEAAHRLVGVLGLGRIWRQEEDMMVGPR